MAMCSPTLLGRGKRRENRHQAAVRRELPAVTAEELLQSEHLSVDD